MGNLTVFCPQTPRNPSVSVLIFFIFPWDNKPLVWKLVIQRWDEGPWHFPGSELPMGFPSCLWNTKVLWFAIQRVLVATQISISL
jgi:hypothetical protein